jgi:pyruvate,water dikinase
MTPSDVSGVLFTANPLTGLLSEAVIDAVFGLGEALVSGQVEPDHFVVDAISGELLTKCLGAKQISTRGKTGGGVENVSVDEAERQTLSSDQIRQLAALGQAVQKEYGAPQDIEWAFAGGKLYLLQSRPITSLFPVPQVSFNPLIAWFAFGAVQGLVGPITPLGRDTIQHVAVGAGKLFDLKLKVEEVKLFVVAGERIWIKVSDVIHNPLGNRVFGAILGYIEPSIDQILRSLVTDPRFGAGEGRLKLSTVRRLAHFALPVLAQLLRTMFHPEDGRRRFDAAIEEYLKTAQISSTGDRFARLANIVGFVRERVANALPFLLPRFVSVFGPSMGALNFLTQISGDRALALEVTRGLPDNVTTQMDLALWETALAIQKDTVSRDIFLYAEAPALAASYLNRMLPSAGQTAVAGFLDQYGMRGVGEIDIGQPRWRDDPTPVMHALQSYLHIDPEFAPDVQFAKGEKAAKQAIEKLAIEARAQRGGWLKEKLVRGMARRIRILMSARESPKFFAIRTMGIAHSALLEVGREFVAARTIENSNDLFFLSLSELEELSREDTSAETEAPNLSSTSSNMNFQRDWKALILKRRGDYQRELRRRQAPRVLVSDGRAFYEGIGSETDTGQVITGSPVSPGVVEGIVHVVLDPRGAQLVQGEILVCPGTDPAWTPLFMAAGGLITEVGGMMTHGSVVAREYGIPAVVGVHQATLRLKSGQRIRLDGASGKILLF